MLAVVAFGAWGALSLARSARDARDASELRTAFATLRYNAMVERRAIEASPARADRAKTDFFAAARQAGNTLQRSSGSAGALEVSRVEGMARVQAAALEKGARLFAAVHARKSARAKALRHQLERQLTSLAGEAQRGTSDFRLRDAGRWPVTKLDLAALVSTGLVFLLGLAAATFPLVRVVGLRRREETERRRELERLEQVSLTDSLTGLRNHRSFHEDMKREIARRNRTGSAFALIMVDLNGLKQINDTQGHQAGDERIKAVADCLKATLRDSDRAYRIGGDEFTVILPGERAWGALTFAQRLHGEVGKRNGFVAVSVGVAESIGTESKDTLVKHADLALYEAKRSHLGTVVYSPSFEPPKALDDEDAHQHHQKLLATALARAVDAKDAGTRNHCETVAELCGLVGRQLGLEPKRIQKLRIAGLVHDVGKIGIADAILQKPGGLAEEESEIMHTHPVIGHDIVVAAELVEEAKWVLHHHERYDGGGYPVGLAGEEIPLEARIICVVDAFEAITTDRPYRAASAPAEALEELVANAGTQFDPRCVQALCSLFDHTPSVPLGRDRDELSLRRRSRASGGAVAKAAGAGA